MWYAVLSYEICINLPDPNFREIDKLILKIK